MTIRVNLRELIHFYDSDRTAKLHSNAIKTLAGEELNLAALDHYFRQREPTVADASRGRS